MLKIHFSQNDMRNMMLIQQTLIQYLLQKKNLCEIFKVLTIWGNINLFIRPQHHDIKGKTFNEKLQVGKGSEPCATVAQSRNGTEKRLHWDYAAIDLRF